jgi:hypothetical protein
MLCVSGAAQQERMGITSAGIDDAQALDFEVMPS